MWRAALRFSTVGLEMGVAVAVGYGIGWWLDEKFGTEPYLMLTMLFAGIVASFKVVYRATQEMRALDGEEEEGKGDNES
jgi:ATP synthase protein I